MSENMLNVESATIRRAPNHRNPPPRAPTPTPPPLKTKADGVKKEEDVSKVPKVEAPKELKEAVDEGATSTPEVKPATLKLEASAKEQKGRRTCLKCENSPISKKENADTSRHHCCDDLLAAAFENDEYIYEFKMRSEAVVQTDDIDQQNTVAVKRGMVETLCDMCFSSGGHQDKNSACTRLMKRKSTEPEVVSVAPRPTLIPRGPISYF